ncbi:uncharacterized protein LOC124789586 isoform X2 [Schistocerca piceifrons]|uniref:uncharacterized protein LOC124789586 isoform X2 n=1 Tax=Schistocerca piceifrons TaxID=274613 RepID=UPI001F5FE02B|nr:uncharacterized protein LOC124789586 isoform X2 [Schistocerca piceifrons]
MAGCWLFLAAITGLLLAAAAAFAAAVTPQVQAVKAAPGSSVRVDCASGSSASSGGGWNPLGTLSNLLLGYSDEEDDDDDNDDDDGVVGSSGERAGDIDVQGGKNWSVRVFNWVLVRRNPATGQVEVKLQVPGLFSSPAGGSGDYDDDVDASDSGREARSTRLEEGVARHPEAVSSGVSSPEYSQSGAS